MGWLGEYSDPADQQNAEALMATSRPLPKESGYDHNYWLYAAIIGALILVVWVLKKPFLEWFRANQFSIKQGLTIFLLLCLLPAFLFWLAYKPKTDTWSEWAYSAWIEISIGFFGIIAFTVIYYAVSFVYKRTRSHIAGWIAFFVMLIFANQLLTLLYS